MVPGYSFNDITARRARARKSSFASPRSSHKGGPKLMQESSVFS